jgi:hypothetical protein
VIFPSEYSRRHHARLLGLDGPVTPDPILFDRIVAADPEPKYVTFIRGGIIAPRSRPGSPGGARPDARRLLAPGTAGGEETAQQPACGQLPQPRLPVLGVTFQPLEDPGQLTGDHGFALAEQPPGVLHQQHVIAQRESFEHPFA